MRLLFTGSLVAVVKPSWDDPDRISFIFPNRRGNHYYTDPKTNKKVKIGSHSPYVRWPGDIGGTYCDTNQYHQHKCELFQDDASRRAAPLIRFVIREVPTGPVFKSNGLHYAKAGGKDSILKHLVFLSSLVPKAVPDSNYFSGTNPSYLAAYFTSNSGSLRAGDSDSDSGKYGYDWSETTSKSLPAYPAGSIELELGLSQSAGTLSIEGTDLTYKYTSADEIQIILENATEPDPLITSGAKQVQGKMMAKGTPDYDFSLHRLLLKPAASVIPLPIPRFSMGVTVQGGSDCFPTGQP